MRRRRPKEEREEEERDGRMMRMRNRGRTLIHVLYSLSNFASPRAYLLLVTVSLSMLFHTK